LQNIQSQQSIVRTDFTLRYYQLDELLSAHRRLKICGANSPVFIRSWLEFAQARQDIIIPWLSGDIEAFFKIFSHIVKDSVVDFSALAEYLDSLQSKRSIVIIANANTVAAVDLTKLLETLNHQQSSPSQPPATVTDSAQLAGQHHALANILIFAPEGEQSLVGYQEVLSQFPVALDVGGEEAKTAKSSRKGLYSTLGAGLVIGCAGLYWQTTISNESAVSVPVNSGQLVVVQNGAALRQNNEEQQVVENFENLPIESVAVEAIPQASTEEKVEIASLLPTEIAEPIIVNPVSLAVPSEILVTQSVEPMISDAKTDSVSSVADIGESVPKPSEVASSQMTSAETVAITTVSSVQAINIGSSINTQAGTEKSVIDEKEGIEKKVNAMVDAWISAWQQQKFDSYSQHYVNTFSAKKKMSHDQWLDWRRKRIERPKWIKLSRSNIKYVGSIDDATLSITFTLNYTSPNYKDKTFKKLGLTLIDDAFKIVVEENLKVTKL